MKKPTGEQGFLSLLISRFKRLLVILAIVFPVALGLAVWLAFFTDVCAINNVVISGNTNLSVERVRELSGVDAYDNLTTLPVGRLAKNIENDPWVKEAKLGRHLLNTLTIEVVERKPLAVIDCCGVGFLLDESGFVICSVSMQEFPGLTRIKGEETKPPELEKEITDDNIVRGVKVMASMNEQVRAYMKSLDPTDVRGQVFYSNDGFEIIYGDQAELEKKNEVLEAVLDDIRDNNRNIEYLDIRVPDSPVIKPK